MGIFAMENKKSTKKKIAIGLTIVVVAAIAIAAYIGAFVLQRAPKIEAEPTRISTADQSLSEIKGADLPKIEPLSSTSSDQAQAASLSNANKNSSDKKTAKSRHKSELARFLSDLFGDNH